MIDYIKTLEEEFQKNADSDIAKGQSSYMRNQFKYFGIKSPLRKEIQKPFLIKKHLPNKSEVNNIVKTLWQKPQREFKYFTMEFLAKYNNQLDREDISLFEFMIFNESWWDTIDFIAPKLVGSYFKKFPDQIKPITHKWLDSGNIWLQRSCIIFQLNYKSEVDTVLLSYVINRLNRTKEFFINKAIGWMLRNYSRINPDWVVNFTEKTELSNLSKREALRLIKS